MALLLTLTIFITIFMVKSFKAAIKLDFYTVSYHLISICILFITYLGLNIYDFIKNKSYLHNTKHNIISIVCITIILLLFIRVLYDQTFLANVSNFHSYYSDRLDYYYYFELNIAYIESNTLYIDIVLGLLILYRFLNHKKSTK